MLQVLQPTLKKKVKHELTKTLFKNDFLPQYRQNDIETYSLLKNK